MFLMHISATRIERFDRPFVRLLAMLAHHPDFESIEKQSIQRVAQWVNICAGALFSQLTPSFRYLRFYIELLVNQNNANLLYHLAGRIKTVRDVRSKEFDEVSCVETNRHRRCSYSCLTAQKLYTLSEVALLLINHHAKQHGMVLSMHGGKETMPRDVFAALPSTEAAKEVSATAVTTSL